MDFLTNLIQSLVKRLQVQNPAVWTIIALCVGTVIYVIDSGMASGLFPSNATLATVVKYLAIVYGILSSPKTA